jgi:hypothetical protein
VKGTVCCAALWATSGLPSITHSAKPSHSKPSGTGKYRYRSQLSTRLDVAFGSAADIPQVQGYVGSASCRRLWFRPLVGSG